MLAGVLEIQMLADLARLKQDMDRAQNMVGGAMRTVGSAVDSATAAIGGFAAGLTAGGFALWIKGAIDAADALNDLSKSTSIATETLAGLKLAALQSGSDLEGTAQAINKLSQNIGKDAERFAKIGVTAKEPLEAFKQLSDVFKSIEDPQLKAAFGAEALGKGWAAAAPLMAEGGDRIQEMVDKGMQLSGVTQDMVEDSDAFNDRLAELQTAVGGVGARIGNSLLPILTQLAEDMTDATDKTGEFDTGFNPLTETLRAVVVLAGNTAFVIRGVGTEIGGLAAQVAAIARGDIQGAFAIGKMMKEDAERARTAFDAWEAKMMSVGTTAKKVGEASVEVTTSTDGVARAFVKAGDAAEKTKKQADPLLDFYAELIRLHKEATKELDAIAKANEEWQKRLDGIADPIIRQAEALEEQVRTYGWLDSSIQDSIILRKEESLEALRSVDGMGSLVKEIETEIEARKRLRAAMADKEVIDANKKASEQAAREWEKIADDVNRALTDAIMRGGKSGLDYLKDYAKTYVLRVAVQAVMSPITGMVQSAMGGLSSSGGGYGPIGSAASSANGIYSGTSGNMLIAAGNTLGSSSLGLLGTGANIGWSAASEAAAAYNAAGMAAEGFALQLGAAIPYIAAAAAAYKIIDSITGSKGGPKSGGDAAYGLDGQLADPGLYTPADANAQVASLLAPVITGIESMAKALGGSAETLQSVALGYDTDPNGSASNRIKSSVNGEVISLDRDLGRDQAALQAGLATEVNRIMVAALQDIDLVDWADEILAGIDPVTASADQLAAALANLNSMQTLAGMFEAIGVSSDSFSLTLVNMLGGFDAAAAAAQAYYENFHSEEEKRANTLKSITAALNAAGSTVTVDQIGSASREQWRDYMESIADNTDEESRRIYAAMLSVSAAFASVTPSAQGMADTVTATVEEINQSLADLASERSSLERDLLVLQGGDLRALDTQGYSAAELAAYDYNAALRDQIDALNAVAAATEKAASERLALEETLLQLQGDTEALRARELSALDETNRALQEQIYALEDAATAAEAAAQAQANASAIDQQRRQLEIDLMNATGDAAGAVAAQRELELEALDDSLHGLQEAVWAAEDLAAAAQAAADATAAAAASANDYYTSIADALLKIQKDAEAAAESATTDAADQWLRDLQSAFDAESAALENTVDELTRLADSLHDFSNSLNTKGLSPEALYAATRAEFEAVAAAAMQGDRGALDNLQSVSQAFIDASSGYNASSGAYFADLAAVQGAVSDASMFAEAQVSIADQQLDYLKQSVEGIIDLNETLLSVAELLAIQPENYAGGASSSGGSSGSSGGTNGAGGAASYSGAGSSYLDANAVAGIDVGSADYALALSKQMQQYPLDQMIAAGDAKAALNFLSFADYPSDLSYDELSSLITKERADALLSMTGITQSAYDSASRIPDVSDLSDIERTAEEYMREYGMSYEDALAQAYKLGSLTGNTAYTVIPPNSAYGPNNYILEDIDKLIKSGTIPAYAAGGYHNGGWAMVGETGKELVNFSQPARIYTASQTQSMISGEGSKEVVNAIADSGKITVKSVIQVQNAIVQTNALLSRLNSRMDALESQQRRANSAPARI